MNNRNTTWALVIAVILLGIGFIYVAMDKNKPAELPVVDTQPPSANTSTETPETTTDTATPATEDEKTSLKKQGDAVLEAFNDKDCDALEGLIDPDKGVRFSPSGHVNTETDRSFTAGDFAEECRSGTEQLLWGYHDASGAPLMFTVPEYIAEYITEHNYLEAPEVYYDEFTDKGLNMNNAKEAYPKASFLEYHFPGFDPNSEGMDWESLRLAFEEKNGTYYLVGVIHDWHSI